MKAKKQASVAPVLQGIGFFQLMAGIAAAFLIVISAGEVITDLHWIMAGGAFLWGLTIWALFSGMGEALRYLKEIAGPHESE